MKLSIYLLLITTFSLSARGFSQEDIISLNVKNADMSSIIKEIRKISDYRFLFRVEEVNKYGKRNFRVKKANMDKVMQELLKGTLLTYMVENNIIIIRPQNANDKKDKKTVKGKVVDEKGNPLPGVSVIIKGTSVGVSTDNKGQFTLDLPKDEKGLTLLFSFIGMEKKEIKLKDQKDQKEIKVVLKDKKEKLDEVIISGFKTVKKEHFTGNATVVSKKEVLKANPKNVIQALQIFDPSFRLKENSKWGSDPNSMPEFNIRGESSIGMEKGVDVALDKMGQRNNLKNNPNLPIFIMDGFEVSVQTIYDMDINRIENITILKDAAATALYGSRAANGVILLTTTAPKDGKFRVNYNLTTSVDLPDLSDYNMCNAAEKLEVERLAGLYEPTNPPYDVVTKKVEYLDKLHLIQQGVETDWMAQPLKNIFNQKHSLYIEGGSGHIRYGINMNIDDNSGVMKGSYRDRKSFGFNFIYHHENLSIRNQITYDNTASENSPYGTFDEYVKMCPYYKIYNEDGDMIPNYYQYAVTSNRNPLYKTTLLSYDGRQDYNTIRDNFSLDYRFLESFRFKTQFTVQKTFSDTESFEDPLSISFYNKKAEEKGKLSKDHAESLNVNLQSLLYYTKKFDKNFINIVGGLEISEYRSSSNASDFYGFQTGSLHSPLYAAQQMEKTDYAEDKSRTLGILTSFNYSFDDTYLLDGSFRYDGSSKFGSNKRFAPFWSVGAGVNLHKMEFMYSLPCITRLKLRASYGSTGKINFPSHYAITTFEADEENWSKTGAATSLVALGNENLKWETTKTLDAGFDLSMFNGKLNVKGSYYKKNTVDLISDIYIRHASGFDKYKINSGEVENKGYELFLNAVVLRTDKMILSVYGNIASNKNKIVELSDALEKYNEEINAAYDEKMYNSSPQYKVLQKPFQQYYEGASTTSIYAVRSSGIDPCTGVERFIRKDGSSTFTWYASDQVVCGNTLPEFQGSFGFNLGYGGFFVNASFLYEQGGQKYNTTLINQVENAPIKDYNVDKRCYTSRWVKPGDIVPYQNIGTNWAVKPTSRFLQDNDFISFNSLSFGYDFSKKLIKKLGLSTLGLKLNMNDIARWSTIKVERGINYPYCRSYSLNLNMSF